MAASGGPPRPSTVDDYHVLDLCGEGSFGKVYKGRRRYDTKTVALKFIGKAGKSTKDLGKLRTEIRIQRALHHPNIILMLDSFETPTDIVLVTEFAQGELFEILEDDQSLPEIEVQKIAKQVGAPQQLCTLSLRPDCVPWCTLRAQLCIAVGARAVLFTPQPYNSPRYEAPKYSCWSGRHCEAL